MKMFLRASFILGPLLVILLPLIADASVQSRLPEFLVKVRPGNLVGTDPRSDRSSQDKRSPRNAGWTARMIGG